MRLRRRPRDENAPVGPAEDAREELSHSVNEGELEADLHGPNDLLCHTVGEESVEEAGEGDGLINGATALTLFLLHGIVKINLTGRVRLMSIKYTRRTYIEVDLAAGNDVLPFASRRSCEVVVDDALRQSLLRGFAQF